MITIIPTSTARHLGKKLKSKGHRVVYPFPNKDGKYIFPDGECYIRLPHFSKKNGKKNERIVLLHSGMPDPNEGIIELEMMLQILKVMKICAEVFFTYMPYSMQDKAFDEGEINAAESLVKKLLQYYGVKKIYTIDAHFHGRDWVKKYPIKNIETKDLIKTLLKKQFPAALLVAPDEGSQRRLGLTGLKKQRKNSFEVDHIHDGDFFASIKGKTIAVMDDLVETGGTLVRFQEKCKENGAKKIIAVITHGVLESGIHRVKNSYSKLFLTNTIDRKEATIDIVPLIKSALRS